MDISLQKFCFLQLAALLPADRPSRERTKYLQNINYQNQFSTENDPRAFYVKNGELKNMIYEK
jgi:hypothetical protein